MEYLVKFLSRSNILGTKNIILILILHLNRGLKIKFVSPSLSKKRK